jgi:hypothetical protein
VVIVFPSIIETTANVPDEHKSYYSIASSKQEVDYSKINELQYPLSCDAMFQKLRKEIPDRKLRKCQQLAADWLRAHIPYPEEYA